MCPLAEASALSKSRYVEVALQAERLTLERGMSLSGSLLKALPLALRLEHRADLPSSMPHTRRGTCHLGPLLLFFR